MDPFRGNCEIMEVNEDLSSSQRHPRSTQARQHHKERQPRVLPKGSSNAIQDDINKLFEAIAFRTSNGLNLSGHSNSSFSRKNASKKPMRGCPSISTGIGFSEPVSLKQSLRGLCISQAGEMAAKRLSKSPGSPGILDAGGSSSMHMADGETTESGTSTPGIVDIGRRSSRHRTFVETTESGASLTEGRDTEGLVEISLVPAESSSSSLDNKLGKLKEPKMRLANQNSCFSPGFAVNLDMNSGQCSPALNFIPSARSKVRSKSFGASHFEKGSRESKIEFSSQNETILSKFDREHKDSVQSHDDIVHATHEAGPQLLVTTAMEKESHTSTSGFPDYYSGDDSLKCNTGTLCLNTDPSSPNKKVGCSSKLQSQVTPKLRRNAKSPTSSSSTAVKSNKQGKSIRSSSRAVKPAIRKRNLHVKKLKQERVITASDSMTSEEIGSSDYGSNQLICHKCQCSVRDIKKEPNKVSLVPFNNAKTGAFAATNCGIFDTSGQGSVMKASESTTAAAGKGSRATKFKLKGEFSQSSKSSMGEYSTSTSVSDDSNVSGSSCGNRQHMSKDFRWEAINNVKKQHGFLGLKHFNLIKKLGSGDIGTVYLAELVGTNCPFAIKVMDNEFLARRKKMPRARTEREILRMLDHPFLPTLYAQFTSDNLSCLVMEFCPGGDLHVLRQKQPGRCFPEQEARFYVAEVLLALEYLHMLGIVYRDLKPENIMVREDGHIMLTDFDLSLRCSVNPTLLASPSVGIEPPRISGPCAGANCIDPFCAGPSCKVSCFTPRMFPNAAARARKLKAEQAAQSRSLPQLVVEPIEARSNSFVGTHEYLAPEIIKGEGHGSAVDWWTLGVFLYELLYGRTPFKGPGNEETLANVVLQSLRFPNSPMVSFPARDLIRGLLVKEPANRFGTETGAAEIKRHPFFDGLNWALIRCAIPPQIPEFCDVTVPNVTLQEKGKTFLEYSATGEPLEFELF